MSADLLARSCVRILNELREEKIKNLRRCKPRPPTEINGAVVPAATAEEIAFYAIDTNSTIDTINRSIEIIESEFKKIVSPEEPEVIEHQARDIY